MFQVLKFIAVPFCGITMLACVIARYVILFFSLVGQSWLECG